MNIIYIWNGCIGFGSLLLVFAKGKGLALCGSSLKFNKISSTIEPFKKPTYISFNLLKAFPMITNQVGEWDFER